MHNITRSQGSLQGVILVEAQSSSNAYTVKATVATSSSIGFRGDSNDTHYADYARYASWTPAHADQAMMQPMLMLIDHSAFVVDT